MDQERIYLVGYMGSGKTTLGKKLAAKLDYAFVDLDALIEQHYRIGISRIFSRFDEDAFRLMERKCLMDTVEYARTVVATGGGTPCFFDNMEVINRFGFSIYVHLPIGALVNRLSNSKSDRPLISNLSPEELAAFISEKMTERNPYYSRSHMTINGLNPDLNEVVKAIFNTK